jgi:hypothetical protein
MKNLSHDKQRPSRDSNEAHPKYKYRVLPLDQPVLSQFMFLYKWYLFELKINVAIDP